MAHVLRFWQRGVCTYFAMDDGVIKQNSYASEVAATIALAEQKTIIY